MSQVKLGVIGYGKRIRDIVRLVRESCPEAVVAAVTDIRPEAVKASMRDDGIDVDAARIFDDADTMLDSVDMDGVLIGTRCDLHAVYAIKVMRRNLPLYLEKPIATSIVDLLQLRDAARDYRSQVLVSFPMRVSGLINAVRSIVKSGKIGQVEHVQAWNNVPYGAVYFQDWYRDESITQGLFLQKATHDFDYINSLLGDNKPRMISALTSKQVFKGDHPAGLRCMDCAEKRSCYESPYHLSRSYPLPLSEPSKSMCAFAVDTGNEDSGSALVQYESGMHMVYSQNFFARNKSQKRGATLLGYHGTIEFDWYTGILKVLMHHAQRVETYEFDGAGGHGGGDQVLASNFIKVIRGEEASLSTLDDGITSVLMCLKARESAATHTFQEIALPQTTMQSKNGHEPVYGGRG